MTNLKFYNGLREIGGTFVEVETDLAKCMFDFGFGVVDRMDDKVKLRKESAAADYVTLGLLSPADGIYDKENAAKLNLQAYGETKKECFFVISHMHIDHMGGLGLLHQDIPVYMSEESLRLYRRLEANGDVQTGGHKNCIGIPYGESFTVGDITVKVIAVDHDVVGACGFLITTPDGSVCYTGDYRFHGYHPERTEAFAQQAKGADVMITEGVTVSFDDVDMLALEKPEEPGRTEETLLAEVKEQVTEHKGLLVINPYNRNVERIHRMAEMLKEAGRTLVLDVVQADYVQAFYPEDKLSVYENILDEDGRKKAAAAGFALVTREALLQAPEQYVLQLDYANFYELIDLKDVVSSYFHMDGAPLGSYDPSYQKMSSVLEILEIPYEYKGTGGHAAPYYLRHMVDTIAPKTLIPLHSFRPEQVNSDKIKERFLPKYGESYRLGN
jgi:mRNA degradation ribonuclease J1/J2